LTSSSCLCSCNFFFVGDLPIYLFF
jgi:hypothetical protein